MSSVITTLIYVLIFPGLLFSCFMGLLLAGIDRKIVAKMQRRVGPPLAQPLYDFFKLVGKDHIIPRGASRKAFILAPILGIVSVITISLFIPIFGYNFKPDTADVIVIIYLLTIPAVSLIMGGSSSGSPYAGVGISREMVTMLSYELPLVIVLLAVGAKAGLALNGNVTFSLAKIQEYQASNGIMLFQWSLIPAAIAFLLVIPAEVGSVPFDVAEAETEICEGPLVEYSGFYLGMYKLTQSVKMFIMASLFIALFLGGKGFGTITGNNVVNLLLNIILLIILCIAVVAISISFIKGVIARIKVEQTLKFFWTIPTGLALLSLLLAYLGF
ncbi:respiratory chain complex I subunit 1 family protein [Desnuesiella massiliensis]|uniref:respiratory chain complex I subunit 1 family protein n=1 Tax=Desnuesiella massiliensis TaxID=1650662 RepID=UPI0006E14D40|nr:complex I subunit 1 family protein [Desnuesiella massiliensis]